MADRLTQLQDCLDQLATQMFSALMYTTERSGLGAIPGQPDMSNPENFGQSNQMSQQAASQNTQGTQGQSNQATGSDPSQPAEPPKPATDPPEVFTASLHELARDLILKEQQIEMLIGKLPGIGTSEAEQNQRLKELEERLVDVEKERVEAIKEKERLLEMVDSVILRVRRV